MNPRMQSRRRARAPMYSSVNGPRATPPAPARPAVPTAPEAAPAFAATMGAAASAPAVGGQHPLTRQDENSRLRAYETGIKDAFAHIVPTLKRIAARQHEPDFETWAQEEARKALGVTLPADALRDAWIGHLDMRAIFAHAYFETFKAFSNGYFETDPLETRRQSPTFRDFLLECGFHAMNVTPCSDGRLAHTISYVLRLPMGAVRRKSYAGATFDVEEALQRWSSVELSRFREGVPNLADAPTRYLKVVAYHYSSRDPEHQGCAAHGSDTRKAATAGLEQLRAFRKAVESSYCCGASIEVLLIGIDTDTDRLRVHFKNGAGEPDLDRFVDAGGLYRETQRLDADAARARIRDAIAKPSDGGLAPEAGMQRLMARLIENNLSQIDYVRAYEGEHYPDAGHEERFIGVGTDFEEIHLRNLTYFAFMKTLEEGAPNLDVGIKIFRKLNVSHGLPIPIVLRFDFSGQVPGARERAIQRCARVAEAIGARYPELAEQGLIQTYWTVRDTSRPGPIECVGGSLPGLRSCA
ncbi:carboxysome shell carbonic anhydrase [Thiorhodococcus minor]|nr:carboxysome shell carbonic anhydrase [Thiorhodococcus minor]